MRAILYGIVVVLGVALTGCGQHVAPLASSVRAEQGLVIVLTGIEGQSAFNQAIVAGLAKGGVPYGIELVDWTSHAWGPVWNLRSEQRNRRQAGLIADRIVAYQQDHPGKPVYIVGQSGGGGMAIWVAEALPFDGGVDGVIVLEASLSSGYPLDTALGKSRQGIVSFHSERDVLFSGVGTTVVGTLDGQHEQSAGRVGFALPQAPSRLKRYRRLYQIPWQEEMAYTGHHGLHLTGGAEAFVQDYVAPFVLAPQWNRQIADSIVRNAKPASTNVNPPVAGH